MDAKELKIGNKIFILGQIITVEQIVSDPEKIINGLGVIYNNGEYWAQIATLGFPLPLTENWLLKFGFERFPWGYVKDGILIRCNKDKFWIELGNGKIINLSYVHTIQNFFSLIEKELEIKL